MAANKITLMALGDIWLARRVAEEIIKSGVRHPFIHIAEYLRTADIVFGNLESAFSSRGLPDKNKDVAARATPDFLEGLTYAGIDVVSLANNHIMDYGSIALQDTLRLLDQNGIRHLGAGMTREEAKRPLLLTRNGITISLHAYLCWGEASRTSPGPAGLDKSMIAEELSQARDQADFVIVSLHGGVIFQDTPTVDMIKLTHWAIDKGADVIIGHHPHVIQGIEKYKSGMIAYSLGNFLFDSYEMELPDERVRQGLCLQLEMYNATPPRYEYQPIPIRISDRFQVQIIPQGEQRELVLQKLSHLSSPLILSPNRGYLSVDKEEIRSKIKDLLNRKPRHILKYVFRNFFRLLRYGLSALFRLSWRRKKLS